MRWFFGWCAGFAKYAVNAEVDEYGGDYQEGNEDIESHWGAFFGLYVLGCGVVQVERLFGQFVVK